jgi:hypothetical protein
MSSLNARQLLALGEVDHPKCSASTPYSYNLSVVHRRCPTNYFDGCYALKA